MQSKTPPIDACQLMFENSLDAVLITIPNGKILTANPAACTMFAMSEAEICAAGREGLTDTTDPRFTAFMEERKRSGRFRGELIYKKKDGSTFPAETTSVILGENQRAFVTLRDISVQKQADETLRQTVALLEGITNGTEDIIAAQDPDFRFIFFNEAYRLECKKLWGREPEIGMSTIAVMAPWPEEQRKARDLWSRALNGETFSITMDFGQPGQERQTYDFLFNPIYDSRGQQIGAAHIIRNVTERVRMQQALLESKNRLESMIKDAPVGMVIFDRNMRYVYASNRWLKDAGLSDKNVIGKSHYDFFPNLPEHLKEAHRRGLGGESLSGEDDYVALDGTERTALWEIHPWVDYGKLTGGIIFFAEDITDRKQAEKLLRESEATYRRIFEQAALGMGRVRFTDARWLDVNDAFCRMLGYSHEEICAMPWPQITHPEDLDLQLIPFRRMAAGELDSYTVEKRYIHKCGYHVWARLTLSIVRDVQGHPDYEIAIIENINERKRVEEELRKAKAAAEKASNTKSEFLANMSHEIRTPMSVFMMAIEHLLLIDKDPDHLRLLEMADDSSQRLRTLIDDILDFSRIEARQVKLEEEPFDLRKCVQSTVEMMRLKAQKKNLPLKFTPSPDLPHLVLGDSDRLGQILFNLLANAIKFTPEGSVEVSVQVRENLLEFSVSDTGIGVPQDKKNMIFQSFSQADSSFRRKFGGSGLGLAISEGLVQLMGGKIGVRNGQEKGSVFYFTLPLKLADEQFTDAGEEEDTREVKLQEARILLAEDDSVIRDLILTTLARGGWLAEFAENGLEAVRKWQEGDFDLIIMDLQMPELNGLEATRIIREKENGHHVCIIGLTAHVRREVKEDCLAAGMDKVLTKPVRIKELYSTIESCLSERKQGR
ncbi:MAG: PAS domain S-box protein [Desulfuromonadales bacterium]